MKKARVNWQPPPVECRVVPLNPTLQPAVSNLELALDSDVQIIADVSREDFFNIITDDAWYYVHVYGNAIYLVEYLPLAEQSVREGSRVKSPEPENRLKEAHTVSG